MNIERIFKHSLIVKDNMIFLNSYDRLKLKNQTQTQDSFSEKWTEFEKGKQKEEVYSLQKEWFFKLYGFDSQEDFKNMIKQNNFKIAHFHEQEACYSR